MIEIERIEIVTPIHGRPGAVMAQRVETIDGRTRFIEPIDLLIGFDGTELPPEVQDALAAINTQQQNTIVELKEQLTTLTSERDAAVSQATSANEQIATLQNRISELTAPPPNPFPDADWANFKFAILADEAIQRVANENATAWPLMVLYLSQLDTNPARGLDIAALWNFMDAHSAVSADEIARINAIAETHGVPLSMNAEGQIVLP